jgi:glycosyltransferase involved in cell wall biosynthesis
MILWHHDLAWTAPRYQEELHPGYPWDLLRMAWPGARQVTISEARRLELAELMGLDPDEVTVVPAGLDLADFLGIQARTWSMLSRIHLMNFSPILLTPVRVTRRKNLELALKVLAELRERMPQAALVITGPPGAHNPTNQEYLDSLYRLRADLGLEDAAFLLAEYHPEGIPEAGVAELYRVADAMLLPSREEGFGIPVLEAGLARLPIFCSDLQALRALAGEWAVYFSPDDSPRSIAKQIAKYLKADPRYQLQTRVRQEYTWEAVYQRQIAPLLEAP